VFEDCADDKNGTIYESVGLVSITSHVLFDFWLLFQKDKMLHCVYLTAGSPSRVGITPPISEKKEKRKKGKLG
jgi:hypothetical protein